MTAYSRGDCPYPSMADCVAEAAQVLADICAERETLAATAGTGAVAEAAWYPGHQDGSEQAIQARYEALLPRAGAA